MSRAHLHSLSVADSAAITRRVTSYSVVVAAILLIVKAWAWW